MNRNQFNKLFIFELANNHMGDLKHALKLVNTYSKLSKKFKFKFAIKLQYRDLKNFIHTSFKNRTDLKFIKRFKDTELSVNDFNKIVKEIKKNKIKTIATPFDEKSVELIKKQNLDYIKVASCSFEDWSLLEKIAKYEFPLILSTAGAKIENIDRVVNFFKNRNKDFCLLHCVAIYPTPDTANNLSRIDLLKKRYPDIPIGFSTHENPDNFSNVQIAIAKGATVFEKHVGIRDDVHNNLNDYSSNLIQTKKWLESAKYAFNTCNNIQKNVVKKNESKTLKNLKRGLFIKKNILKNKKINPQDIYLAFPPSKNQITSETFSKYNIFVSKKDINKNQPLLKNNCKIINKRKKINEIIKKTNLFLNKTGVNIPENIPIEISHHYGLNNFKKYGLVMFTIINRNYCKKILILFPNQKHPEQFHKKKEETFNVLHGNLELKINNEKFKLKKGEIITIKKLQNHSFFSKKGCIIEELSTTHEKKDSFYTDKKINNSKERKTILHYWKI